LPCLGAVRLAVCLAWERSGWLFAPVRVKMLYRRLRNSQGILKMERYHKKIGFPQEDNQKLIALTDYFNAVNWQYTAHCLDTLKCVPASCLRR
jgi:hypothetical protein